MVTKKYFKIALLSFGAMSISSIIFFLGVISGDKSFFIDFISSAIMICSPILYLSGFTLLIISMFEKEAKIIISIMLGILATIIFLFFYGFSVVLILIGFY